jgi:hypothetical protein
MVELYIIGYSQLLHQMLGIIVFTGRLFLLHGLLRYKCATQQKLVVAGMPGSTNFFSYL